MKTTVLASLFAAAAVTLSACSSVPDLISVNAMKIDGKDIYLRGEMNDYAAISSNPMTTGRRAVISAMHTLLG